MHGLPIGEVAKRSGLPAPTIRYYEEIGLLSPPGRTASGYRAYAPKAIDELRFVKKAQGLGFTLDEITEILKLSRAGRKPCDRVLALSREHLHAVDERIRQLRAFQRYLASELERWDTEGASTDCDGMCRFIEDVRPGGVPAPEMRARPRRGRP